MIANALFSRQSKAKGFTLLELLIVITILAILAVIIIFVLNPAETLRKSRDVQRMSDLATLKNAIGLYTTVVTDIRLDGTAGSATNCFGVTQSVSVPDIWLSVGTAPSAGTAVTGFATTVANTWNVSATASAIDGTGWIPVDFTDISGGSPISNLPIDPQNTLVNGTSTAIAATNDALMYRYSCRTNASSTNPSTYEVSANLESNEYKNSGTNDKESKDGGNNNNLYEAGTDLTILPNTDTYYKK